MLNRTNTIQPVVQRCYRFERGRCQRGQSCRFIHSEDQLNLVEANHVGISCQSSVPVQFEASVSNSGNHGSSVKVCRHFRQKGWCAFGDSCHFLHLTRIPGNERYGPVNSTPSLEHLDLLVTQDAADDAGCQPIRPSKGVAEKKICKFYKAGFCRYGQKCHYNHVGSSCRRDGRGMQVEVSSLNEQCVQLQSSANCADAADFVAETQEQKREDVVDTKTALSNVVDQQLVGKSRAGSHILTPLELEKMRETEIQQLCRRFPRTHKVNDLGEALFKFVFEPTDPDWPYDVKQIHMEVSFPQNYPAQMMTVRVKGSERIPAAVERSLTESIENWITERYNTTKATECWELMFRPMLRWLDKNAEILMTDALKEYKRELIARAAGLEFVPAAKLRQMYPDAANRSESVNNEQAEANNSVSKAETENCVVEAVANLDLDTANGLMTREDDEENCSSGELKSDISLQPRQRGTEVKLCGLQLTNGAATLVASRITLLVVCNRCTNTNEVHLVPSQIYQAACSRCHVNLLIEFSSMIAHQMSAVIGWLNLDGCRAFDLVMADSQFMIGCIGCAKEEKVISLSRGNQNSTWCRHCHQKLTVFVENVRFLQLSASVEIDVSKAIQVDVKKRIKTVHDPAIQEGLPLPNNGTCRHYKKSFRWLRFPCCGKAYPCDKCHNELETDHEMKLANRMICGFCAKEQAYAAEKPCVSCSNIMTNKSTAHWEGGKGCRDQIKMSRNDSKKYSNSMKTQSLSSSEQKVDTSKKKTKLRHV